MITEDNIAIDYVDAFRFKEFILSDRFGNRSYSDTTKRNAVVELANSLSEEDNPVLMLIKLKE